MRKIIAVLFVLCSASVLSQIAYYDVLKLRELKAGKVYTDSGAVLLPDKDGVYQVLKHYVSPADSASKDLIARRFATNPFMRFDTNAISHGAVPGGGISQAMSALGGLDVTNIANGVADFMIERAKEELTIAFFNRFKKFAEKHPEFGVLFPKTTENLANLLSYQYPQMMPVLRRGFLDDLDQLSYNLEGLLQLPAYADLLKNFPEIRVAIRSLKLVRELERNEMSIPDIIEAFAAFEEWNQEGSPVFIHNMGNSLKLGAVFSGSLRSTESQLWVKTSALKKLWSDSAASKLYLGLIYQLSVTKKIGFKNGDETIHFATALRKQKNNLFMAGNTIQKFCELAERVERQLEKNKKQAPTNEDYYNYLNTAIDAMEYSFTMASHFDNRIKAGEYVLLARKSTELFKNIYSKEYPQAISNSLDIIEKVVVLVKENPRYASVSPCDRKYVDNLGDFIPKVTKYALFMGNVAVAKSSGEVKAALDAAALPAGSSSIKKNTSFNLAVQSYLGAYAAMGPNEKKNSAWNDRMGVIAPIGISISTGMGKFGSFSLFPTVFDLGAIVDYKLTADSVSNSNGTKTQEITKDYKVQLGQLFSPGGYLVYGMAWNLPISIGVGGQYGPGLSKIDAGANTIVSNPSWRWNVFLSVDIPFFNLATIRKKN